MCQDSYIAEEFVNMALADAVAVGKDTKRRRIRVSTSRYIAGGQQHYD